MGASAGLATGAISGPPAKWKMPLSSIVTCISSALPSLSKPCEDAASPIWLADDLDRSDRLLTDSHVDVMHQEVSAGEHFVDVGADDGDRWFTDHMAGRNPPSRDGVESRVWRAVCVVAHVISVTSCSVPRRVVAEDRRGPSLNGGDRRSARRRLLGFHATTDLLALATATLGAVAARTRCSSSSTCLGAIER